MGTAFTAIFVSFFLLAIAVSGGAATEVEVEVQ